MAIMRLFLVPTLALLVVATDASVLRANNNMPRQFKETCNDSNACAAGLDCVRTGFRKTCLPVSCAVEAAASAFAEENFDLGSYGQRMMDISGVTWQSPMFRPFQDTTNVNAMDTNSSDLARFLDAVKNNPPPLELIQKKMDNCTESAEQAPPTGTTLYYGASWGIGAGATYNGDVFWGQGSADAAQLATLNNCFGFILGYDAGVSGLLGFAFTDSIAATQTDCKQMFPIVEFPPFALEAGFINCANPIAVVELTLGLSAGAGLPGFTSCTATAI